MKYLFGLKNVNKHIAMETTVQSIPSRSMQNFFLDPWMFDFSEKSKYGAVGRFPTNHQYCLHFQSFLENGFESHREALDVKFATSQDDKGLYVVHPWSVGFVDGQGKALLLQSILAMIIWHAPYSVFISKSNMIPTSSYM